MKINLFLAALLLALAFLAACTRSCEDADDRAIISPEGLKKPEWTKKYEIPTWTF